MNEDTPENRQLGKSILAGLAGSCSKLVCNWGGIFSVYMYAHVRARMCTCIISLSGLFGSLDFNS